MHARIHIIEYKNASIFLNKQNKIPNFEKKYLFWILLPSCEIKTLSMLSGALEWTRAKKGWPIALTTLGCCSMFKGILEHADAGWGYFFPRKKVAYWNSIGSPATL